MQHHFSSNVPNTTKPPMITLIEHTNKPQEPNLNTSNRNGSKNNRAKKAPQSKGNTHTTHQSKKKKMAAKQLKLNVRNFQLNFEHNHEYPIHNFVHRSKIHQLKNNKKLKGSAKIQKSNSKSTRIKRGFF